MIYRVNYQPEYVPAAFNQTLDPLKRSIEVGAIVLNAYANPPQSFDDISSVEVGTDMMGHFVVSVDETGHSLEFFSGTIGMYQGIKWVGMEVADRAIEAGTLTREELQKNQRRVEAVYDEVGAIFNTMPD